MRYALSSTKLFASDATLARSLTFLQARPQPSGNTTSVGERRRQASPRSDQGFLRAGAGIHRRQADRDHTERSEEHTSELQSLMRKSYAVFCLKKKKNNNNK